MSATLAPLLSVDLNGPDEFEVWRDGRRITRAEMEAGAKLVDAYLRSRGPDHYVSEPTEGVRGS